MKDFSIVIAHRGDPLGLWATVHACEAELERSKFEYEYCLYLNGDALSPDNRKNNPEFVNPDAEAVLNHLDKRGLLGFGKMSGEAVAPPTARQLCADNAHGKYLFFFDNHCIPARDYFRRAILDFENYPIDVLHSATRYMAGDEHYHYKLCLDKNFWGEHANVPDLLTKYKPYRMAAGGHGGFAVRLDSWKELGGYWTGFTGYGGEEIYFDLKTNMRDKQVWLDPLVAHYHYPGRRGYKRHFSDGYYRNMMMCANIIGGEEWLNKVYDTFSRSSKEQSGLTMFDLYMEAQQRSAAHAAEIRRTSLRTLDEQLAYFRQHEIAC